MKKGILFIGLFCFGQILCAQMGISKGFQYTSAPSWKTALIEGYELPEDIKVFPAANFTSVDLALASKKKGFRFLAEFHFSKFALEVPLNNASPSDRLATEGYESETLGFALNLDIFPLSFKRGARHHRIMGEEEWWKDILFIRLGAGVSNMNQIRSSEFSLAFPGFPNRFGQGRRFQSETLQSIRLGLGLEIQASSFMSFSPLVQFSYSGKVNWTDFGRPSFPSTFNPFNPTTPIGLNQAVRSSHLQTLIGIRLGIYFKQMSKQIKRLSTSSSL